MKVRVAIMIEKEDGFIGWIESKVENTEEYLTSDLYDLIVETNKVLVNLNNGQESIPFE